MIDLKFKFAKAWKMQCGATVGIYMRNAKGEDGKRSMLVQIQDPYIFATGREANACGLLKSGDGEYSGIDYTLFGGDQDYAWTTMTTKPGLRSVSMFVDDGADLANVLAEVLDYIEGEE
jgi:hypothetical protein